MAVGAFRPFQEEDVPWFLGHPRSMNLYEPRLGKTVVSVNVVGMDPRSKIVLVACSKNAMGVWYSHFKEWFAEKYAHRTLDVRIIRGKGPTAKKQREEKWLKPRTAEVTVYICTFNVLANDFSFLMSPATRKSGLIFDTVIADEVHMRMKNRKTKTNDIFKVLTSPKLGCHRYHPLSGTLAGKGGPADFWAILNQISPNEFSSYWRFVNTFCDVIDNGWGKEIVGIKNATAFWALLDRFSRRRFRKDCATQMPKIQRDRLYVEMDAHQQKAYQALEDDSAYFTPDGQFIVTPTSLEAMLRKRQLLACPAIFDPALGVGAAFEDFVERISDESATEDDRHTVVFTAFRNALPHFERRLREAGFHNVWQLFGGLEPEDLEDRIRKFKATKGIILCSIKYAQAFSLVPAQTCYFIGPEWDPNDNKQAEDRLIPQVGVNPINSYYYHYRNTVDDNVIMTLDDKNSLATATLGSANNLKITS